jgi:hypothetical protein
MMDMCRRDFGPASEMNDQLALANDVQSEWLFIMPRQKRATPTQYKRSKSTRTILRQAITPQACLHPTAG